MGKLKIYDSSQIEAKWRKIWQEKATYEADIEKAIKPFYNLWMFPYPSGEGLHSGHAFASTGSDVYGRYQRMRGYSVFQPIGYDSFGIHSENYAIKIGSHPAKLIPDLRERYKEQLMRMGHGYDWSRTVTTSDIEYYRWTQLVFVKLFEAGLVERRKAKVNWCPSCKTVLADEQVIDGKCERCSSEAEQKDLEQWFFKMASGRRPNGKLYVESLLENIEKLDWSEIVTTSQRNWIGKKEGAKVKFLISNFKNGEEPVNSGDKFSVTEEVFTTRIDTIFGVTFLVVAPEVAVRWQKAGWKVGEKVSSYINSSLKKTEQNRKIEEKEKTGEDTGLVAVNPASGEEIPVYVADYVLLDIGTGLVMGVPAHDRRDFEFAIKYKLKLSRVIDGGPDDEVYEGEGKIINSGKYNGLDSMEMRERVLSDLEVLNNAHKYIHYHLRDWLISRQRYWGAPIPMIFCDKCNWQAVPEDQLPVELPYLENFKPTGTGEAPLSQLSDFVKTKCPKCGGEARRETDVCDTFLDSSWYFMRYPDANDSKVMFERESIDNWLPVHRYIGGAEHANLHLLYSRFVTMAFYDLGLISCEEPFKSFRAHGLLIKDGHKMSKSKGNVISPDALLDRFGADTLRCYLMFIGPFEKSADFRDAGVSGMFRWLNRVWNIFTEGELIGEKSSPKTLKALHQAIASISRDIEDLKYNTVISTLMEVVNLWKQDGERLTVADAIIFLKLLAPLAPHMTEELYQRMRSLSGESDFASIHTSLWPESDEALAAEEMVTVVVQVNGKVRAILTVARAEALVQEAVEALAISNPSVAQYLEGKSYKPFFVPGRLINLVVG